MTTDADYPLAYASARLRRNALMVVILVVGFYAGIAVLREDDKEIPSLNSNKNMLHEEMAQSLQATISSLEVNDKADSGLQRELHGLQKVITSTDSDTLRHFEDELELLFSQASSIQEELVPNRDYSLVKELQEELDTSVAEFQRPPSTTRRSYSTAQQAELDRLNAQLLRIELELGREEERQEYLSMKLRDQKARIVARAGVNKRRIALDADMDEIRTLLKPFITPGHCQPASATNAWDWDRTIDKSPVSLSKLQRLGALEESRRGLEALFIFGGAKARGASHDRPLGEFPKYWSGWLFKPDVLPKVQRAQELLLHHGQAMVEQGLLSK